MKAVLITFHLVIAITLVGIIFKLFLESNSPVDRRKSDLAILFSRFINIKNITILSIAFFVSYIILIYFLYNNNNELTLYESSRLKSDKPITIKAKNKDELFCLLRNINPNMTREIFYKAWKEGKIRWLKKGNKNIKKNK